MASLFGDAGEQADAATGFTYLRARYLHPSLGRFLSADSVQPNAPGSQGYNLYAYVANNPTTWVDPSGQAAVAAAPLLLVGLAVVAVVAVVVFYLARIADSAGLDALRWTAWTKRTYGSTSREGTWTGTAAETRAAPASFPADEPGRHIMSVGDQPFVNEASPPLQADMIADLPLLPPRILLARIIAPGRLCAVS